MDVAVQQSGEANSVSVQRNIFFSLDVFGCLKGKKKQKEFAAFRDATDNTGLDERQWWFYCAQTVISSLCPCPALTARKPSTHKDCSDEKFLKVVSHELCKCEEKPRSPLACGTHFAPRVSSKKLMIIRLPAVYYQSSTQQKLLWQVTNDFNGCATPRRRLTWILNHSFSLFLFWSRDTPTSPFPNILTFCSGLHMQTKGHDFLLLLVDPRLYFYSAVGTKVYVWAQTHQAVLAPFVQIFLQGSDDWRQIYLQPLKVKVPVNKSPWKSVGFGSG